MHIIENDILRLKVSNHGAELHSIFNKQNNREYLWQGDPTYWGRRSPVLFPIVGKLANNKYYVKGREYHLTQHGFARDMEFEIVEKTDTKLKFILKANEKTMMVYPFNFKLSISYTLENNKVVVKYKVYNNSTELMYFSIGAHPAFNTNISENGIEDYYLDFGKNVTLKTKVIDKEVGLVSKIDKTVVENSSILDLKYQTFENDALILEGINSVSLKNRNNEQEVRMVFEDFPLVGIWTSRLKEKCPFLCIEPWYGMADYVGVPKELVDKAYIQSIYPDGKFQSKYSIEIK